MKLSELTDEQISQWIAEKLEPKPAIGISYSKMAAEGRLWWYGEQNGYIKCWPRDMVSDPAMTVMLLEKLLKSGFNDVQHTTTLTYWKNVAKWECDEGAAKRALTTQSLGRAVAEAFMLANGWTE